MVNEKYTFGSEKHSEYKLMNLMHGLPPFSATQAFPHHLSHFPGARGCHSSMSRTSNYRGHIVSTLGFRGPEWWDCLRLISFDILHKPMYHMLIFFNEIIFLPLVFR